MSQSVIIAGVLLFLFLVYVTAKGQLPSYLNILGLGSAATGNKTPASTVTPLSPIQTLAPITVTSGLSTTNLAGSLPQDLQGLA